MSIQVKNLLICLYKIFVCLLCQYVVLREDPDAELKKQTRFINKKGTQGKNSGRGAGYKKS